MFQGRRTGAPGGTRKGNSDYLKLLQDGAIFPEGTADFQMPRSARSRTAFDCDNSRPWRVCRGEPPAENDALVILMASLSRSQSGPTSGQPAAPAGPADEELVRRLKDGDASAGVELVRRYEAGLMGYLRRLGGSDHMAEELHQATWLSVLEHLDKFDAEGSGSGGFKAWLFRIATNKANDWWRRSGREQAARSGMLHADEARDTPVSPVETAEQIAKLREAISRLPASQREVLLLRYFSGLKFVEIAEMLGCPLNTALGRMHKAMTKLKRLMDEED